MTIKKFTIAGGNSTLLAWDCPSWNKKKLIEKFLGEVEQIGFVSAKNDLPKLSMMGNELCINSTLALASQLTKKGKLLTSGIKSTINYTNMKDKTFIEISLPYERIGDLVIFSGIGFIYLEEEKNLQNILPNLCRKYHLPAFGAIIYKNQKLKPYVYVLKTSSLIAETACGSGSIALNIIMGISEITQPTGKKIFVKKMGSRFTVGAKVVRIEKETL